MLQHARSIGLSLACLALVGCVKNALQEAEAAGARPLDAAALRAQYPGNTLVGGLPDLEKMRRGLESEPQVLTVFFSEDGRLAGMAKSKLGVEHDRGRWKITDAGELCLTWSAWVTEMDCRPIHAKGDEHSIFAKEGGLRASYRMHQGNVGKLSVKTPKEEIVDSGARALGAPEATALYSGNTASGRMPKDSAGFVFYFAPGGVAVGRLRSAAGEKLDSGTWRIGDGGEVCLRWTSWDEGEERCNEVFEKEGRFVSFDDDDEVAAAFKIAAGNSKDLALPGD